MPFLRIIDVNLNRLDESLKLIEDVARFHIADRQILQQTRKIRNALLDFKKSLPLKRIVGSRRSAEDPGRAAKFDARATKSSTAVIISNLARAKEASRILEETCKVLDPGLSGSMKEIRFKIYDLEKEIVQGIERRFDPRLHVIIDEKYLTSRDAERVTRTLMNNGATMIQLRIKTLSDRAFLKFARRIRKTIGKKDTAFIINNRPDIAVACNAHGLHLGQTDMPISAARRIMGDIAIIGASARTTIEARKAESEGADYLGVGALYTTSTKSDSRRCTITTLRAICRAVEIPVIGIGGINNRNYRSILRAGASGIAVASFIFEGNMKKNLRSLTRK
ncbi:MAG: thiamine phosphate synthase [candidate division WOR-3 bacterium]|nr:MAG: thiamine phosphate synthase [candidate division WOR-3 bacterium]